MEPPLAIGNLWRREHHCSLLARRNDGWQNCRASRGGVVGPLKVSSRVFAGSAGVFFAGARRDPLCRDLLPLPANPIAPTWRLGLPDGASVALLSPLWSSRLG